MKAIFYFLSVFLISTLFFDVIKSHDVFKFERSQNEISNESDGLCPNNKTKCSSSGTCCTTKHNSYHCCHYRNAVCCSDKYHCCPEGTTCDLENKRCQRNDPMEWKVDDEPQMTKLSKSDNLVADSIVNNRLEDEPFCPNKKNRCKATKTCCITKHGNYYCCPHKNAVCCSDKWTCCPEGSTCDVKNKKCLNSTIVAKMNTIKQSKLESTDLLLSAAETFLGMFFKLGKHCGNSQKSCPGEKRCCPMSGGGYGCCKYRKGVCCPDFASCCPHDTQCDIKNKVCTAVPDSLVPAVDSVQKNNSICPDNRTQCLQGQTCCSVGNVLYGCCPLKDATCCSDKTSCCPHNKKCDLANRRCVAKDSLSVTKPSEVKPIGTRKSLVVFLSAVGVTKFCPNQKDQCKDEQTCCASAANKFGCCPYTMGTCCSDGLSCCPQNYLCTVNGCI